MSLTINLELVSTKIDWIEKSSKEKFRTGHQMGNSTELSGHDHAGTMMSKVKHRVSDILPQHHENEEEARQWYKTPETPDDEKISMTKSMFMSIMTKALEEQKILADENTMQVAKVAFTAGNGEWSS